jgi:hypothetical protein
MRNAAFDFCIEFGAMCQAIVECGKIVSKRLPTIFPALLIAIAISSAAKSGAVFSTGISGGEQMLPFATMNITEAWKQSAWDFSMLVDARSQFAAGIGDANAKAEWHGDTDLAPQTELALDVAYNFVRERGEAIKQFHTIRGDIGLEREFESFKVKADAGAETRRFQNTTQKGYSSLNRSAENLVDSEAAIRVTVFHDALLQPFIEAAFVERDYFKSPDRGFAGPELIGGITFAYPELSGDFAVMLASRDGYEGDNVTIVGPYVDLKWQMHSGSEISLGLGAGIEQDTSGLPDLYPYYSGRFEILREVMPKLKLSFVLDAVVEHRITGCETELSPTITLAWTDVNGFGVYSSAGMTYTKIENVKATFEPGLEVGFKWAF